MDNIYKTMFDNSSIGLIIYDTDGNITDVNQATVIILGSPSVEATKQINIFTFPPLVQFGLAQKAREAVQNGESSLCDAVYVSKWGKEINFRINVNPLYDIEKKIIGGYAFIEDITKLKTAEYEIKKSEERYRLITENINDVIWTTDLNMIPIYVSPSVTKMMGFTPEERSIMALDQLFPPKDYARMLASFNELVPKLLKGEIKDKDFHVTVEVEHYKKDGTTFQSELTIMPIWTSSGQLKGIQGVTRDITEKKQAQEKIQKSEEMLRTITDSMLDMVILIDLDGTYEYVSPSHKKVLGFEPEDLLGKNSFTTVYEEDLPNVIKVIHEGIVTGTSSAQYRALHKDGHYVWVESIGNLIKDKDGNPSKAVIGIRDINERKKAEELLMLDELRLEILLKLNQMDKASIRDLMKFGLEEAVRLTGSEYGYLASVSEDGNLLNMFAWNEKANIDCKVQSKTQTYPVKDTGLWGEAVRQQKPIITNNYDAPNMLKKGLPEGHVKMKNHMNIPVFDGNKIIFLIGVANKPADYDEIDIKQIQLLMSGMLRIIKRKQAEDALLESEQKYRVMVDALEDLVFTFDTHGKLIAANKKLCKVFNLPKNEILGKAIHEIAKDSAETLLSIGRKVIQSEKSFKGEASMKMPDGLIHYYDTVLHPIFDEEGNVAAVNGIARDVTDKKLSDEAMKKIEARFKDLAELLPEIVFEFDENGFFTFVNINGLAIMGYTQEELYNNKLNVFDMLEPEYIDIARNNIRKQMTGEYLEPTEYLMKRKDGTIFPAIIYSNLIIDKDKYKGARGIVIDITARKEMNQALSVSEAKFKDLAGLLPEIVFEFDENGTFNFVNINGFSFMGYTQEEFDNRELNVFNMFAPESVGPVKDNIRRRIMGEHLEPGEYLMKKKDGTIFPAIIYSNLIMDKGKYMGMRGIVTNITARKEMEQALRISEQKYKYLLEQAETGIFVSNVAGDFLIINSKVSEMLEYTKEDFLKLNLKDVVYKEDQNSFYKKFNDDLLLQSQAFNLECKLMTKTQKIIETDISIKLLYDGNIQGIIRDISEHKRIEKELLDAKEISEKANKAKTEFLANMSHEIRTPLNAIIGFTDILSTEEYDPEKTEILKLIKNSSSSLLGVINDILDLAKIESGKIKLVKQNFNIEDSIKLTVKTLQTMAGGKGLSLRFKLDDVITQNPNVLGDEFKLKQILTNLINNAIKFTEKGEIIVNAKIKEKEGKNILVECSVKDTGIGIPENLTSKIFEQFVQAEHYLTKRYKGTGLGLAIVNSLIKFMGGSIKVKSKVKKGSEFIFTLPFELSVKKTEMKQNHGNDNTTIDLSYINILIAEDDDINQALLRKLAKKNNLNIEIADNGEEAINKLKCKNFDIVLMDIMMPVMDGSEATQKIRAGDAGENNKNIPVIALTAHAMREQHIEFIEAGMDYVIVKPVNINELIFLIQKFCCSKIITPQ